MDIVVVYIYPQDGAGQYHELSIRFLDSYHRNPPGRQHDLVVVCNGSPVTEEARMKFSSIPRTIFLEHDNSGYDLGGFQRAAREIPCDLMVFFGVSTYFRGGGWLDRMVWAYQQHGMAQYGTMGNMGDARSRVHPHLRTTAFWMPPELMNGYPIIIQRPEQRYGFEHGPNCFTSWVRQNGFPSWVVNWRTEYNWPEWNESTNGFHRGNQSDLLVGDRFTMPPYYPHP